MLKKYLIQREILGTTFFGIIFISFIIKKFTSKGLFATEIVQFSTFQEMNPSTFCFKYRHMPFKEELLKKKLSSPFNFWKNIIVKMLKSM